MHDANACNSICVRLLCICSLYLLLAPAFDLSDLIVHTDALARVVSMHSKFITIFPI